MPHVHNGLHEYSRLLDAAARAIGEKSGAQDFTGIERFGETLTPTINLWELPEWALLRGEKLFGRDGISQGAGGAGVFSTLEFVNPATSNILAVVLEIHNNAANVFVGTDTGAALGAAGTARGVNLDLRVGPNLGELSQCTMVVGQLAAGVALPVDLIAQGERAIRPYILPPGTKLFISPGANTASSAGMVWSERPLLPTEERA